MPNMYRQSDAYGLEIWASKTIFPGETKKKDQDLQMPPS